MDAQVVRMTVDDEMNLTGGVRYFLTQLKRAKELIKSKIETFLTMKTLDEGEVRGKLHSKNPKDMPTMLIAMYK